MMRPLLFICALALCNTALAGAGCEQAALSPMDHARAAETARKVRDALETHDAPLALVSRHGTDLSKYGLHYSHMGFVVRDHPNGRWTIVHLLNECGTAESRIYAEGLVNFFAGTLVSQDVRIDWLAPSKASRLLQLLEGRAPLVLHDPDYNMLARFDSKRMQNSTAWNLEMLAATQLPDDVMVSRPAAQAQAARGGHRPDIIHVPYGKRLVGGIFTANVSFTDHPVRTRLSGDYPVVTVRSVLRYLEDVDAIARTREWRGGRETEPLAP